MYIKNKLEPRRFNPYILKYMKKLFKKKTQTTKLIDEFAFLSPACTWVNKLPKKKLKQI
tara:strand:- start:303 stop:479 length:177 start_codon:yes stop_codon:yes gene_type:complete